ncbi:MAG: hypothetical protein JJV96_00475 [Alphaproteobacteria bacterium]|nr:hypothetical protein [Alphaproteobacteria bacterium]
MVKLNIMDKMGISLFLLCSTACVILLSSDTLLEKVFYGKEKSKSSYEKGYSFNYFSGKLSIDGHSPLTVSYTPTGPIFTNHLEKYIKTLDSLEIVMREIDKMLSSSSLNPIFKDLYDNLHEIKVTSNKNNKKFMTYSDNVITINTEHMSHDGKYIRRSLEQKLYHMYIEKNIPNRHKFESNNIFLNALNEFASYSIMYEHYSDYISEETFKKLIANDIMNINMERIIEESKKISKLSGRPIDTVFPTQTELDFFKRTVYELGSLTVDEKHLNRVMVLVIEKLQENNITLGKSSRERAFVKVQNTVDRDQIAR